MDPSNGHAKEECEKAVEGETMIWSLLITREFAIPSVKTDPLEFRVEVFGGSGPVNGKEHFRCRVWRYEVFQMSPLSETAKGGKFHHACLVLDGMFDGLEVEASSSQDAFEECRSQIFSQLKITQLVVERRTQEPSLARLCLAAAGRCLARGGQRGGGFLPAAAAGHGRQVWSGDPS